MALKFPDMVAETSVTTGTNDMELAGAVAGFRAFGDVLSDGDTVPYAISYGDEFETGIGTWNDTTGRLERTAVYQSSNNDNKVSFSAGTKKVIVGPLGRHINPGLASKSADYTVLAADFGAVIVVDASGDARTITLPAAATAGAGFKVTLKKADSSFNTVTIDGDGAETIDGAATKVLRLPRQSATLICDGTGWHVFEEAGTEFYGSNESGTFTRFASGIQDVDVIVVVDLAAGATIDINYPASFIASPRPAGTISATNSGTAALQDVNKCSIGSTGTGWRIRNNGTAFSGSQSLHLTAKGRWF